MLKQVRFTKLREGAKTPVRKNSTDAGLDLYACIQEGYVEAIVQNSSAIIDTGISLEVPEGYFVLIKPKGKNKHLVGAGVVDAYYHPGEIKVKVVNSTSEVIFIENGDAIAQAIFIPIETPELVEVGLGELRNTSNRSGKGGILNATN